MRQFRVYYMAASDARFWACDIEVTDEESWDHALVQLRALPNGQLFPTGVGLNKNNCEFTSALELDDNGYKGEAFSTTPREVTEGTQPESEHFPRTEVVDEVVSGMAVRRVVTGLASNYIKYKDSAKRAKAGLDKGVGEGKGNNGKKAFKGGFPPEEAQWQ